MPLLKTVEEKIQRVEKFSRVAFTKSGTDMRSDKTDVPQYEFSTAAPGSWTVAEWKAKRFNQKYPGYDVKVFGKDGSVATGNRTLENLRGEK